MSVFRLHPSPDEEILSTNDLEHIVVEAENKLFLSHELLYDSLHLIENVDVCYIDPPYNTGNSNSASFTYNDSFGGSEKWLEFMEERLLPLKQLLKPTGVVIVSIDDSEVHHLRVLMDNLFGRKNFIAQVVVDSGSAKNNARFFSVTHEYMLVYANNLAALYKSGVKWRKKRDGVDLLLSEYESTKKTMKNDFGAISKHLKQWVKTAPLTPRLKMFYNADARGLYTYADLSTPSSGARYDVIHPVTGKPCKVPSRGWGITQENMEKLIADDRIIFPPDDTSQPLRKLYLKSSNDQVQKAVLEYSARYSTHLLEKILGKRNAFNNPKNLDMMIDLLALVTPVDGVVLDYFAGSGTTGHAVMALNKKENSKRKFVLVSSNENEIFNEVTLPRLQKAATSLKTKDGLKVFRSVEA